MNTSTTQNDAHTGGAGIDLRHHLGLLVRGATDHENDDILWLVPGMPAAFEERILQLFQTTFDKILEGHL